MSCKDNEVEVVSSSEIDPSAIAGTVIATILILAFIITFLVFRFQGKELKNIKTGKAKTPKTVTGQVYHTMFDRLGGFFGGSIGQFSIGMMVAILVSDVVGAFNGLIITPIVQVAIPDQTVFTKGVDIGRNVWFYPGQFFLSLLGFILSLLILFFIIEGFYQVSKLPKTREVLKYGFMAIILIALLGLMGWNIYAAVEPQTSKTCVKQPNSCEGCQVYPEGSTMIQPTTGAQGALSSLVKGSTGAKAPDNPIPPITPMRSFTNPMGGVRFGI